MFETYLVHIQVLVPVFCSSVLVPVTVFYSLNGCWLLVQSLDDRYSGLRTPDSGISSFLFLRRTVSTLVPGTWYVLSDYGVLGTRV